MHTALAYLGHLCLEIAAMCAYLGQKWLEIAAIVAELLVALVIYMEVEGSRLDRFYEHTLDSKYTDTRRAIFDAFLECDSPRHEAFMDLMTKGGDAAKTLRHQCEGQIAWFQRLGTILPWLWPNRGAVLSWFPQSVVFMWVIHKPYIEIRRHDAGEHWAFDFERLVGQSANYLLKRTKNLHGITLTSYQVPGASFHVSRETLRGLKPLKHTRLRRRLSFWRK